MLGSLQAVLVMADYGTLNLSRSNSGLRWSTGMDVLIASTPWLALSFALFSFVLDPLGVLLKQKYEVAFCNGNLSNSPCLAACSYLIVV